MNVSAEAALELREKLLRFQEADRRLGPGHVPGNEVEEAEEYLTARSDLQNTLATMEASSDR